MGLARVVKSQVEAWCGLGDGPVARHGTGALRQERPELWAHSALLRSQV